MTIAFSELKLLTRIVPCGSQLWAIQQTWSTGTAEGQANLLRHQISAVHNERATRWLEQVTDKYGYCSSHDKDL